MLFCNTMNHNRVRGALYDCYISFSQRSPTKGAHAHHNATYLQMKCDQYQVRFSRATCLEKQETCRILLAVENAYSCSRLHRYPGDGHFENATSNFA